MMHQQARHHSLASSDLIRVPYGNAAQERHRRIMAGRRFSSRSLALRGALAYRGNCGHISRWIARPELGPLSHAKSIDDESESYPKAAVKMLAVHGLSGLF